MPRAHCSGIELFYETLGPESGPTVLMIMGLGAQLIRWPPRFCDALVAAGYRLILYDNRDVGLSSKLHGRASILRATVRTALGLAPTNPYTLGDMAGDALGLLDALGVRQAHVLGVSMGGMIGQLLTARHPERVRSFVSIMSSSGSLRLPGPPLDVQLQFLQRGKTRTPAERIERMFSVMRRIASPAYPPDLTELRARVTREVERCDFPAGFQRHLGAIVGSPSRLELLGTIRTPTLIVHGAEDPLVPVAAAYDLQRRIPGAQLEVIAGMGHDIPAALIPHITTRVLHHFQASDAS